MIVEYENYNQASNSIIYRIDTVLGKLFSFLLASTLFFFSSTSYANEFLDEIVNEIKVLESEKDPKCYATASRLEDFMFGTPLSHNARFKKNMLQKKWVRTIWSDASNLAEKNNQKIINLKSLKKSINNYLSIYQDKKGHWEVDFSNTNMVRINGTDKRQYSTIAYALRAVLAVQQESLLELDSNLLPLEQNALNHLTDSLDLLSLSVLKLSDVSARKKNRSQVEVDLLLTIWRGLLDTKERSEEQVNAEKKSNRLEHSKKSQNVDLSIVKKIIQQKFESYKAYNKLSNTIFNRNLQVYFARMNLPKDVNKQKAFSKIFTESMIQFAFDLYKESEKIALSNKHSMILEEDVFELIQKFIPHKVDEFEDTIFFTNLTKDKQIKVESYDADSFRDNSAHWRFLNYAINSKNLNPQLQPDPFALELISENIALFGVLSLKMAGLESKIEGAEHLLENHYKNGLIKISNRVEQHHLAGNNDMKASKIISASETNLSEISVNKFTDVTELLGINSVHRSSDWLNRLLRSFLEKRKGVGVVYIPPAFGGSGVAAEDINNDGFTDLLFLSGSGNQLYINQRGKGFKDVTKDSGIEWVRSNDNQPGEVRQPLIADLNNDGLQDIVITYVDDTHRVYQNLGDSKFRDVSEISRLGGKGLVGGPATIADFDNDGLLDIYITYFGNYIKGVLPTLKRRNDNATPNQLFKNMGNFKFKNITSDSGVDNFGWAQAVSHTDFNSDGWQDIIVGNDFGINAYYRNNKDGSFTDLAKELGTDKASYSMNVGITDLNQDLIPDIYISNIVVMNKDEKYVLPNENTEMKFDSEKLANMRVIEANDLFLSGKNKDDTLTYNLSQAVGRGYSSTGWSWDADFFDYDNDGDSDLYVLNGMNEFNVYTSDNPYFTDTSNKKWNVYIPVATKESNVFFINENGKLANQSKNSGIDLLGNSRSAAYLDYDRDGDLDIAVNNFHEQANFFENNLNLESSRWLKLKLIGDPKKGVNRDAIGAKIILTTSNGNTIWREIQGSIGYMSVHPKIQHIGLGDAEIDNIKIVWPNGEVQILRSLEINQEYRVVQSQEIEKLILVSH